MLMSRELVEPLSLTCVGSSLNGEVPDFNYNFLL